MRRHRAAERRRAQRHGKRHGARPRPLRHEGRVAPALGRERQQVELRHEQAGLGRERRVLGEDVPVFRDEVVRGKDGARARLVRPGIGVDIAAEAARAGRAQQRAATGGLAGRLGRGRAVGDHGRPGEAQPHRRRYRRPHVLAQLHAEAKRRHLRAGEHQPRAERHVRPADGHAARPMVRRRGGKAALFREHVVVRQPRFRHNAEDAPAVQHGRAVVELAPGAQRHAEHDDGVAVLRVRADVQQRFFGRIEQQRGQKQVAARVAGHAQLRQHEQRGTRPVRLVDARADRCRVAPGVCHGHGDGRRRRAQETVLHGHSSLLGQYAQKARKKPRAHFSTAPPRGIIQYNMCAGDGHDDARSHPRQAMPPLCKGRWHGALRRDGGVADTKPAQKSTYQSLSQPIGCQLPFHKGAHGCGTDTTPHDHHPARRFSI